MRWLYGEMASTDAEQHVAYRNWFGNEGSSPSGSLIGATRLIGSGHRDKVDIVQERVLYWKHSANGGWIAGSNPALELGLINRTA